MKPQAGEWERSSAMASIKTPLHPRTGRENNHFFTFGAETPKKKKPLLKQQSKKQQKQNRGGGKHRASLCLKLARALL